MDAGFGEGVGTARAAARGVTDMGGLGRGGGRELTESG